MIIENCKEVITAIPSPGLGILASWHPGALAARHILIDLHLEIERIYTRFGHHTYTQVPATSKYARSDTEMLRNFSHTHFLPTACLLPEALGIFPDLFLIVFIS